MRRDAPARRPVGAVRRAFAPWTEAGTLPLIRLEGVTKRFGGAVAVDDLSLAIYEREFFCLLGPSGCGKSTLMRLLAGFETPDAGRILLGGRDLAGVPPHRRPVNMMFQSYALFPHMSVAANVAYGLRQEGLGRGAIADRVAEMLRLVQLTPFAGRRPDQLSGGQRQRVALARALAKRPKVLLLDEPLAALDKRLREETQFELMDLQGELGTTFLVVTHDQEEAMTMADRIAVMDHGRLAQVGRPAEVYEQPASRFVAGFVGDVNLFEGRVEGEREGLHGSGRWRVRAEGASLLVEDPAGDLQAGQAVAVAVRPEKMTMARAGEGAPGEGVLAGTVWDIGYLGDWTIYRVKLEGGAVVRISQANRSRFVDDPVGWDERVVLSFPPDAAVVLRG